MTLRIVASQSGLVDALSPASKLPHGSISHNTKIAGTPGIQSPNIKECFLQSMEYTETFLYIAQIILQIANSGHVAKRIHFPTRKLKFDWKTHNQ